MPPIPSLFTLFVDPKGSIICTQPAQRVYLLTIESPPDNRITPAFCASFILALDILDRRFPKGIVVTTSAISKFYSNGLDYESAVKLKTFFSDSLYPLWRRLLTYVHAQGVQKHLQIDLDDLLLTQLTLQQLPNAHCRPHQRSRLRRGPYDSYDARLSLHEPPSRLPLSQ